MIEWSIVLSVIVGILIVSALPYLIYAPLYIVFVVLPLAPTYLYVKFREIVLSQELVNILHIDNGTHEMRWVNPGEIEYTVVDVTEYNSWRNATDIIVTGEPSEAGGSDE